MSAARSTYETYFAAVIDEIAGQLDGGQGAVGIH